MNTSTATGLVPTRRFETTYIVIRQSSSYFSVQIINMYSGTELQSDNIFSDLSHRFEPGQILYKIIEITGERPGEYKVHWNGMDPETMRPWPQSWVAKSDCTDDLVLEWERKERRNCESLTL